jgi:hypothetical protein
MAIKGAVDMAELEGFRVRRDYSGDIIRRAHGAESRTCGLGPGEPLVVDGLSDFMPFFGPVVDRIDDLYWVVNDAYFCFPDELVENELFEPERELTLEEDETGWTVMKPGFLKQLGPYFVDDWIDLFGVKSPPSSLRDFKARHYSGPGGAVRPDHVQSVAEVAILCIDGLLWAFFARDASLLSQLEAHLRVIPGVVVSPSKLEKEL